MYNVVFVNNTLVDQEIMSFEKNSAYELRKFGPQPDTGCTTAQEVNVYERIAADERESHHPAPVYANVDF